MESKAAERPRRSEIWILVAMLILAALLRGAYLWEIRDDPGLRHPPVDAGFNLHWARGLATGDWTPPPDAAGRDPAIRDTAYQRPPGYPYVLATLVAITGGDPLAIRALQALGGLAAVFLAWRLGRRMVDRWVGLVWAGLMAVHWGFIYFETDLNGMWLFIPLSLVAMSLLLNLVRDGRMRDAALFGLVAGLLVLLRSNAILPMLPFGLALGVVVWRRRGTATAVRTLSVTAVVGALTLAPATIRNAFVSAQFVPVSANGGLTLFHGNSPTATGFSTASIDAEESFSSPWHAADLMARATARAGRPVGYTEASREAGRRARQWIAANPDRFAKLLGIRALLFWGPDEMAHSTPVAADRQASGLLRRLPFGFALALATGIAGLLLLSRRSTRVGLPDGTAVTLGLAAIAVAGWFASFLPFFVASLYRLPVIPPLLFGAAVLVTSTARLFMARRWAATAVVLGGTASAWALLSVPAVPVDSGVTERHLQRGLQFRADGDLDRAEAEYRQALAVDPDSSDAAHGLAVILMDRGRPAAALPLLRDSLTQGPSDPNRHYNLGLALASLGRWSEARAPLEEAVRLAPNLAGAQAMLGMASEASGDLGAAVIAYRATLALQPNHMQVMNNLAWILATAPDPTVRNGPEAVALARASASRHRSTSNLDTLAAALAASGRFEEAERIAAEALAVDDGANPGLTHEVTERLELYRQQRAYIQDS
jgi:Flp pilus assembly protein TadD/4-amino-4-deoxy-L-arabinose transferase-like glycosyltransferase